MHKTADEGLGPIETSAILVHKVMLFCMHKTTDEGWDP